MKRLFVFALVAIMALGAISCTGGDSGGGARTVAVNPNQLTYGTDWSPADLNRIANQMTASISRARWFSRSRGANIRWILANEMANDTDEHINTRVIMEKIRTALINQHEVRFLDDQALTDILRQQQLQQSDLFNRDTVVKIGRLVGARLVLRGRISNMRRRADLRTANVFNVTLQVVDLQTGDIRWTDEAQIARLTTRSRYR
jgi:uncharacterized protein (TIGR02722 family)